MIQNTGVGASRADIPCGVNSETPDLRKFEPYGMLCDISNVFLLIRTPGCLNIKHSFCAYFSEENLITEFMRYHNIVQATHFVMYVGETHKVAIPVLDPSLRKTSLQFWRDCC